MREAMRRKVRDAVSLKVIHDEPTKQQWEMVFSDHPATCVAAGAGSGKSTTLALRVVFMHQYLCIPLSKMTVISFTTKSCEDLRRSLIAKFAHWNFKLTERAANDLVRTYHSALRRAAVSVGASTNFFEYLGKSKQARSKRGTEQSDSENHEKAFELNDENPFVAARLENEQLDLLHRVYQELYESNEDFRTNILGLIRIQLGRDLKVEKQPGSLKIASRRDKSLVQFVNDRWRENTDCWPIEGIDEGPHKISIQGMDFFANGKISSTGEPVFLGPAKYNNEWLFGNDEILPCDDSTLNFPVRGVLGIKRQVLSAYLEGTRIYIADTKSAKLLAELVREEQTSRTIREAPEFSLMLCGEIKPEPITAAFWSQGSFIESVRLDVNDAVAGIEDFRLDSNEYFFVRSLAHFWKAFNNTLEAAEMITYNRCFRLLTEVGSRFRGHPQLFRPFQHLLIDEFQDISPQIQAWIVRFQRILTQNEKFVSIMAVGDDWQSIYGWRGSSPDFFINFDKYFPSHDSLTKAHRCLLEENFRSVEPIVTASKMVLDLVQNKWKKQSLAVRKASSSDQGIKLFLYGEETPICDETLKTIAEFVESKYSELRRSKPEAKVFVMSRGRNIRDRLNDMIKSKSGLSFLTYHTSKGLEADIVVLVGNSVYENNHKLRNRIYSLAGLSEGTEGYDQASRDEAHRTAYVAITRGQSHVYWFVDELKGASKHLYEKAGVPVVPVDDLVAKPNKASAASM